MTTATLLIPVTASTPGDGTTNNVSPPLVRRKGSETAPAKFMVTADFDPSTNQHLWFNMQVPANYASAPIVRLHWMANATSGNVVWGAQIGCITPADADTPIEHVMATASTATTGVNATEAMRLVETAITLANLDSITIADEMFLHVYRDAANGSDTCTVLSSLLSISLDYTTT